MATRLGKFELPNRLVKEEETATEKYAKFIADPFYKLGAKQKKHRKMIRLEKFFGLELSKKHFKLLK